MAFDTYMQFADSSGALLKGESQVKIIGTKNSIENDLNEFNVFEIDSFSFDIEQVLNIGSQSSGAGAGKVTFNPFTVSRKTDKSSPKFFMMCCAGTHFKEVSLFLRRAGGSALADSAIDSGHTFLRFDFALVAIKTISWSGSDGDEAPKEDVAFEYGALKVQYLQQDVTGKGVAAAVPGTWNRVYNNNNYEQIKMKT